jgi:hypothetical protein
MKKQSTMLALAIIHPRHINLITSYNFMHDLIQITIKGNLNLLHCKRGDSLYYHKQGRGKYLTKEEPPHFLNNTIYIRITAGASKNTADVWCKR